MSRKIYYQRSYKIPLTRLELFLVKLDFSTHPNSHLEAEYIFKEDDHYVVVVNQFKNKHSEGLEELAIFVDSVWKELK